MSADENVKKTELKHPLTAPFGIPAIEREESDDPVVVEDEVEPNEILIITGRSGAGRTHAANALEDLDWYVIDNLPPAMLMPLAGMMTPAGGGVHRLAAVVDVRSREFFKSLEDTLEDLKAHEIPHRIVFLDATDEELVRRYEASRRPHPLQGSGSVLDGLETEARLLAPLRQRADEVIDTTGKSIHDLARHMRSVVAQEGPRPVNVALSSFGFKHGPPMDADHVVDVRFIANPYWVDELRRLTGRDEAVSDYVFAQEGVEEFVASYTDLIASTLPGYQRELKPYVTVAVGCTGGRHRSVAIAERIAKSLRSRNIPVQVTHRDMGRL